MKRRNIFQAIAAFFGGITAAKSKPANPMSEKGRIFTVCLTGGYKSTVAADHYVLKTLKVHDGTQFLNKTALSFETDGVVKAEFFMEQVERVDINAWEIV